MIAHGHSIQDEAVPETPGEPYPHPSARNRSRILFGRHRIVEGTVQVAERDVDSHPGNRELRLAWFGHTR